MQAGPKTEKNMNSYQKLKNKIEVLENEKRILIMERDSVTAKIIEQSFILKDNIASIIMFGDYETMNKFKGIFKTSKEN